MTDLTTTTAITTGVNFRTARSVAMIGLAAAVAAVGVVTLIGGDGTTIAPVEANALMAPSSCSESGSPVSDPIVLGQPVVLFGSVACIPFLHLGPNADLAPDPTGQRSSGGEILAELRQRGPNVDLPFDPTGQRSSGNDPICVAR